MQHNKNEQIGLLRHHVWIQKRTTEENAHSEKVEVWKEYKKVWAAVEYPTTKSDEVVTDNGLQVAYTFAHWTIKYDVCVGVLHRIVDASGRIWNVKTVAETEYKTWLKLGCELIE